MQHTITQELHRIILGLGSNVGDRLAHLSGAVARLRAFVTELRLSRIYEAAALLPPGAPADWGRPFLNMALSGVTALEPGDLLARVKQVEAEVGRCSRGHWGPREIDIDILAYGNMVVEQEGFSVPHKEILARDFVLFPLADAAPDWRYPVAGPFFGKTPGELIALRGMRFSDALRATDLEVA